MKKIVLLTGTINPKKFNTPFTKLMNKEERLGQYLDTIYKYIVFSNFDVIIFCENSMYKYNYNSLKKLAKSNGKILEILSFTGDKREISKRGKGYGEGEIMEHALHKSRYLNVPKQTFYKITGRIFIKNINNILEYSKKDNYFFSVGNNHCVTLFFKCSVIFYKNTLLNAYMACDEKNGIFLENVFYDSVKMHKKEVHCFNDYPYYDGVAGTTGKKYGNKIKWLFRQIQIKLNLLCIK